MFNMVQIQTDGHVRLAMTPDAPITGRQFAARPIYDITTVAYAARPEYIRRANSLFDGRVCATVVPEERALDIDTPLDLAFAEFMLDRGSREQT